MGGFAERKFGSAPIDENVGPDALVRAGLAHERAELARVGALTVAPQALKGDVLWRA